MSRGFPTLRQQLPVCVPAAQDLRHGSKEIGGQRVHIIFFFNNRDGHEWFFFLIRALLLYYAAFLNILWTLPHAVIVFKPHAVIVFKPQYFVPHATKLSLHTIPHPFSTPFPVSSLFLLPIFLWIISPASCPCPHPMSTFLNPPPFCSPPPLGHPIYPRFPPLFYIFPALFIFSFSPFSIPNPLSYFSFDSKRSNSEMMRQICLLKSYISFSIFSIYHRV